MKSYVLFLLFSSIFFFGQSQPSMIAQKEAINQLNWIVGEWQGLAVTQMGPARSDSVIMHESIAKDLDGTILKIKGIGYADEKKQKVEHNAFAVISYDPLKKQYRWQSWRVPGGYYAEYNPEIEGKSLSWMMETPRGKMRYKLVVNDKGQWHETGEFSGDGENWNQFLEMLLEKQ